MQLQDLLDRAQALAVPGRPAVLGITGAPGAGKTTLALALVEALRAGSLPAVVHVPMDGYHLADVELERLGRRDRKGAPDTFDAAGYAALLARLRAAPPEVVYAPAFDREVDQPVAGSVPVPPGTALVVTEGNYLLLETGDWPVVRSRLDEIWFCDVDAAERTRRLVRRHTALGKEPAAATAWVDRVDGPNAALVERTRARADLVVPPGLVAPRP